MRAINKIPHFPVVPFPKILCHKFHQTQDGSPLWSFVFFSIPGDPNSHYLCIFTWNNQQYTGQACLKGSLRPLLIFPKCSTKIYVPSRFLGNQPFYSKNIDDLLLYSVTKEAPIKNSTYLLQQLAKKGHKVSKEKLQLSLHTTHYLGHNLSAEGIQLSPKYTSSSCSSVSKKKKQIGRAHV